jgi:2-succinyl-5-enolpyruvyl-6-hydroxy-3-cyclohexene-1-carboxylate synthase
VVQNGGGRIFEQLPIAAAAPSAIERFTTPHDVRFEHAAAAFGVPYARADDAATLRAALDRALDAPGATLIEAVVPPHEARDAERRILGALAEGLA